MNRVFIKISDGRFFELEKAKDLSKLVKKQIVDKNGNIKTVYVKVTEDLNIILISVKLWYW